MLEPDGDGLAAAAGEDADDVAATDAAVLLGLLPWQAADAARPAIDTTATATRVTVRGQADVTTGSSLTGAHRVSYGPPGRWEP